MTLFDKVNELRKMRGEFLLGNEFVPVFDNFLIKHNETEFFRFFSLQTIFRYIAFLQMCFSEPLVGDEETFFRLRINSALEYELFSFYHSHIVDMDFLSIMGSDIMKKELLSDLDQKNSRVSNFDSQSVYSILFDIYVHSTEMFLKYARFLSIVDLLNFLKDLNLYKYVLELFRFSEKPDLLVSFSDSSYGKIENLINRDSEFDILDEISFINEMKFEFYAMRRGHYRNLNIPDAKSIMSIVTDFSKYADVLIPENLYLN